MQMLMLMLILILQADAPSARRLNANGGSGGGRCAPRLLLLLGVGGGRFLSLRGPPSPSLAQTWSRLAPGAAVPLPTLPTPPRQRGSNCTLKSTLSISSGAKEGAGKIMYSVSSTSRPITVGNGTLRERHWGGGEPREELRSTQPPPQLCP